MEVTFVGQPYKDERNLFDFLSRVLADETLNEISVVVAWAKRSGLGRVQDELGSFNGSKTIIVGVDEGGATRQGLGLAIELFDEAYVAHDRRGPTFHPKLVVARSTDLAHIFVGSNNLTAGGLYFNYEAAVAIELDLSVENDRMLLEHLESYIERIRSDAEICETLTVDLIEAMERTPGIRIGDEDSRRGGGARQAEDRESNAEVSEHERIFGFSKQAKRQDPRPPTPPSQRLLGSRPSVPSAGPAATPVAGGPSPASPIKRWTKQMTLTDAQHPNTGNPTGNLRLTKANHDINWKRWFRDDLFGLIDWRPDTDSKGNPTEKAEVEFDTTIDGVFHGRQSLIVDHAPHREAGQANVPTILHWGETIGALLRQTNYAGYFVVIERAADGTYRLEIAPEPPTPLGIT